MTKTDWSCLYGHILDSRFRIEQVVHLGEEDALFRAIDVIDDKAYLLRVLPSDSSSAQANLNRFREAQYLDHPNLLQVDRSGEAEYQGMQFTYLLVETASTDLASAMERESLTLDGLADAVRQVAAGLAYLHSENLVYCALKAESIWRVGVEWKLADFSELRVAGKYPARETRRLLVSSSFNAPPEANQGLISEAWDVWSLGSMVRKLLLNPKSLHRQLDEPELSEVDGEPERPISLNRLAVPYPFSHVLRDSLEPVPSERASLQQIVEILTASADTFVPTSHVMVAEQELGASDPLALGNHPPSFMNETALPLSATEAAGPEQAVGRPLDPPRFLTPQTGKGSKRATGIVALAALTVMGLFFFPEYSHSHLASRPTSDQNLIRASVKSIPEQPTVTTSNRFDVAEGGIRLEGQSAAQREISSLLDQWVSSTKDRDVNSKMRCYAPLVDRFYGQRSVPLSRLHEQVQDIFNRIGTVRKFEIRNVKFNRLGPEWAVVSFDNEWKFGGAKPFTGLVRDELVLRPIQGRWKITSQRELKVYWANR